MTLKELLYYEELYVRWNRRQTSGVGSEDLSPQTKETDTDDFSLTEVNLEVDKSKIVARKEEERRSTLTKILRKL